jgi:hypothetical protein
MSYDSVILADSPVGYWKLDETSGTTAADSSGNGRNGTYVNVPESKVAPIYETLSDQSATLAGYYSYVAIPYNAAFATPQLSLECWVVPLGGLNPNEQDIFSCAQSGGWLLAVSSNGLSLSINAYIGGAYRGAAWTPPVLSGTTFHVVGTYDGQNLRLYVNGDLKDTYTHGSAANITYSASNSRMIGANPNTTTGAENGFFYRGRISNVAYYNAALSDAQVLAHYEAAWRHVSFTINESLAATQFIATARRARDGVDVGAAVVGNGAQTLSVGTHDPVIVTVSAYQGNLWEPSTVYELDDLVFPTNPANTPYYYKRISAGTSGETEPSWPTTPAGQCDDGAVSNAWELVERLIQPITHGPLIPG